MTRASQFDVDFSLVDFDLSADQVALRDAAASLLDKHSSIEQVRARVGPGVVVGTLPGAGAGAGASAADKTAPGVDDAPKGFDRELWAAMAEQGWLAVERPESDGGLAMGMVEVAVLCEELGRRLAPAPFAGTILAIDAIATARDGGLGGGLGGGRKGDRDGSSARDEQLGEWVNSLLNAETVGCISIDVSDDRSLEVNRRGADVELTGTLGPALFAPSAAVVVVVHEGEVFAVGRDGVGGGSRGFVSRAEPIMDRTRELGRVELDGAKAIPLGGDELAQRLMNRAVTAACAEMLGSADAALAMAVRYAKDRVQFGRPIGSFQAIKHKLADSLVDVEGMRSSVYYSAWCASAGDPDSSAAASMAKAWCSDASRRVMATALQVHGGIGFTWEHDMHLFLKRAQLDQVSYGDASFHRDRLAGILRSRLEDTGRVL
ncbi:MAG: acyl-CoA dehydrogenase family protein [Acidimicrobiales bacterium]